MKNLKEFVIDVGKDLVKDGIKKLAAWLLSLLVLALLPLLPRVRVWLSTDLQFSIRAYYIILVVIITFVVTSMVFWVIARRRKYPHQRETQVIPTKRPDATRETNEVISSRQDWNWSDGATAITQPTLSGPRVTNKSADEILDWFLPSYEENPFHAEIAFRERYEGLLFHIVGQIDKIDPPITGDNGSVNIGKANFLLPISICAKLRRGEKVGIQGEIMSVNPLSQKLIMRKSEITAW